MVFVVIAVQAISLALYYFWRSGPPPTGAARMVACRNNCVLLPLRQAAPVLTLVVAGRRSYWTPERREEWE